MAVAALAMVTMLSVAPPDAAAERLLPRDLVYLGAFRLPEGGERPETFAWGGNAMTFRPGTARGARGDLPGSLFLMGHDRMAYGELPNGNQVAEITIPKPVRSKTLDALPRAQFLQGFHDVAKARFAGLDELPRVGMAYLDDPRTGPRLHLAWGQHLQPDTPAPSHGSVSPNLARPDFAGSWRIADQSAYSVNGYMFEIPADWAKAHVDGRRLATGRYRDGGWSGMGPALFAYFPFDENGGAPPPGATITVVPLLRYAASTETDRIERALDGYQHPDEWEGGAWITTRSGKSAVLFAGTKSVGAKYWYGFVNPAGPDAPCVAGDFVGQMTVCRNADGTPCPARDLTECTGHNGYRGWWTTRFAAQFILYDTDDLAEVAGGRAEPHQPQPYARVEIDGHLFHNPAGIDTETLGIGPQRRYRIGAAAYDRDHQRLFVLELFADDTMPVVHVWAVK